MSTLWRRRGILAGTAVVLAIVAAAVVAFVSRGGSDAASVRLEPSDGLLDAPLRMEVDGADRDAPIHLTLSSRSTDGVLWSGSRTVRADDDGRISVDGGGAPRVAAADRRGGLAEARAVSARRRRHAARGGSRRSSRARRGERRQADGRSGGLVDRVDREARRPGRPLLDRPARRPPVDGRARPRWKRGRVRERPAGPAPRIPRLPRPGARVLRRTGRPRRAAGDPARVPRAGAPLAARPARRRGRRGGRCLARRRARAARRLDVPGAGPGCRRVCARLRGRSRLVDARRRAHAVRG